MKTRLSLLRYCCGTLIALWLVWALPASAQPEPIKLQHAAAAIDLDGDLHALFSTDASATIASIAREPNSAFRAYPASTLFRLNQDNSLWIHLRLQTAPNAPPDWTLFIPLPYLDHAELFTPTAQEGWMRQIAGDVFPVKDWTHPGLYPEFTLNLPSNTTHDIYLRIRNYKALSVPIRLQPTASRITHREIEYVAIGAVLGSLLILLATCSIQACVSQDPSDGWYAIYIATIMLVISGVSGLSGQWLWPDAPTWSNYAYLTLPVVGVAATVLFSIHICALEVGFPRFARALQGFAWFCLPLVIWSAFLERTHVSKLYASYVAIGPALAIIAAAVTWRRGNPVGKWLLIAFTPQGLAIAFMTLQIFNLVPAWWMARNIMILAVAASVPLLLHALNLRSRTRRDAEDRVEALPTQDALTGLLIKPLFLTQVKEAILRARRDNEPSAIVLVEVVNHPGLRTIYGEAVAEQCLLRAVVKLHRILRDVDPAGRIDTNRFGLILDGVSSRQAINERMVSLIASGLIPLPGLKPEVTLQFHMACVLLNEVTPDPLTILDQLGEILSSISPRSRRPIRFLEDKSTPSTALATNPEFGDTGAGVFPPTRISP